MTALSRWSALLLTLLLGAALASQHHEADAQEKKQEKKAEVKKKDEKKIETKDEKKEEKKEEVKEEKKVPFEPDRPESELKGHTDWVNAIAYGVDGKTLASASRDRTVRVWDAAGKKDVQTFKGLPSNVKGLAYQGGHVYGATGKFSKEKKAWEGEIRGWDALSGKPLSTLTGHAAEIECLAASRDGKFLASGSEDQTAKVWDLAAGKDVQTFKGHAGTILGVAFNPDGTRLATASADGSVKLWDAHDGKDLGTFKAPEKTVVVKDAKGKESTVKVTPREFTAVAFSPDGNRLAAASLEGYVKVYDVAGQKEIHELKAHDGVWALAYNADGSRLATGGYDQTIKVWDAATGKDLQTIKAHLGTVTSLSFHPSGAQLASGSIDGLIKIWAVGGRK